MCPAWRSRPRRVLPQGGSFAWRSDQVPCQSLRSLCLSIMEQQKLIVGRNNCQVYNARKRGGDNATQYFARTENIAGVKDMRHQELMPDVLHWLGIKKIDNVSRCCPAKLS